MSQPTTASFTVGGTPVSVSAIQTGTITIKRCHHTCCLPERTPMGARFASILADRRWADPLPIWAFAIRYPDALFLVDSGATPDYNDDASWSPDRTSGRLLRSFLLIAVEPRETLPAQLEALAISPEEVDAIVLTHQHIDHTGAVPSFPNATIWTTAAEDRAARQIGACHWRWRDPSTRVRHVDTEGTASGLGPTIALTPDEALQAIHTPGHTPGSVTVVLATDQGELWFTGDTSFTAEAMDPTAPTAGIHTNMTQTRTLQARLKGRGIQLPAHDWGNAARLTAAQTDINSRD